MFKPVTNSQSCNRLAATIKSQSVVECRFPQSSDIAEIVAVAPQVSPVSCEPSSGRVNYAGRLVLTLVYSDEEGKLCRMQKGVEFSHFADDKLVSPSCSCLCALSCDRQTVKREGSSFVVTVVIGAEIGVYSRADRTVIEDAEGAFVKTEDVELPSLVCFSGESEVEDDFDADSVVDVLMPTAEAVVLSATCGTGEVEVSGEIYLSLFAMRQQSPVCIERVIPFKSVIACDDAVAGTNAAARVEISDVNVAATVNEERGKCNIAFSANLGVSGWFTDVHCGRAAVDAFSDSHELKIERAEESYSECRGVKVYGERVRGLAATKARLTYDCTFLAVILPKAECEYNPGTGAAEGVVSACLVYVQNEEIKSCEVSLPFSLTLSGAAAEGERVQLAAAVCGAGVKLKAEGEAEVEATLKICATVTRGRSVSYICGATEGEELEVNDCALSVFLPAAGDGLWEVAKKLKKSPSDVESCNRELTYPLTGSERILIYRGKKA